MDTLTTETRSIWKNKTECVIKIIKEKSRRRRDQINIPKKVWDFDFFWESGIYLRIAGKDGLPDLERLTGNTIYIFESLEFDFYDLV